MAFELSVFFFIFPFMNGFVGGWELLRLGYVNDLATIVSERTGHFIPSSLGLYLQHVIQVDLVKHFMFVANLPSLGQVM